MARIILQRGYCHILADRFEFSDLPDPDPERVIMPLRMRPFPLFLMAATALLLIVLAGYGFYSGYYYQSGIALCTALIPLLRLLRYKQTRYFTCIPFNWIREIELHRNFQRGRLELVLRFTAPEYGTYINRYYIAGPLKDGNPELENAYSLLAENFLFLKVT